MNIEQLKKYHQKQEGQKEQIEQDCGLLKSQIKMLEKHYKRLEQAKEIINNVGLLTQKQLEFHISDVTSLALESVFPDPYALKLNFDFKRGKTECDILFERNESQVKPKDSSGYGTLDIASFALRIASWSMSLPKQRNVIVLDEPFRNLSEEYHEAASQMIKQISEKMKIQFIIVTHKQAFTAYADKVITVSQNKKKESIIKT